MPPPIEPPAGDRRLVHNPVRGADRSDSRCAAAVGRLVGEVLITGASGYLGRPLSAALLERGHRVRGLVRPGSESRLAPGVTPLIGDALDSLSWAHHVRAGETIVHLVGTPRPNPWKARAFERVDFASIGATVRAAAESGTGHLVYVSVAHPAPVMRAYIDVRRRGEGLVRSIGCPATILRPWYVLGPGHRWPSLLIPVYAVWRRIPTTRESAVRLGLVTCTEMVNALVYAVEHRPTGARVVDVPAIRRGGV